MYTHTTQKQYLTKNHSRHSSRIARKVSRAAQTKEARERNLAAVQLKQALPDKDLPLQKTIGTQEVHRLLQSGAIQAKLKIGHPGDKYEQKADRVADEVMRMPNPGTRLKVEPLKLNLQTKGPTGQTKEISQKVESRIKSTIGGGQPLPESTKAFFEPRFGADFSEVRVHTDKESDVLNQQLGSRAFTTGNDIFFRQGEYQPGSSRGDELIAHELVHFGQQKKSPITIQRSPSAVTDSLKKRLAVAKASFEEKQKGWIWDNLSREEIERIHLAIELVTQDNPELAVAFYTYYTKHNVKIMWSFELDDARKRGEFASTMPGGDTVWDPQYLQYSFSLKTLGGLLIHELVHTGQVASPLKFRQEALAYGIELFFAKRNSDRSRLGEIVNIYEPSLLKSNPVEREWRNAFERSFRIVSLLYRRIDGKPAPEGAPQEFEQMSPESAREIVSEYISRLGGEENAILKIIGNWGMTKSVPKILDANE
ncbi:MAG: DUF4157 domain-containing protein [Desulfobulbaceae bacterium]|nr:DUF4157 domain-containing protein [Desulfobulbaceae bacterium]